MNTHRINRLSVNVNTNDNQLAFQLRQQLLVDWEVILDELNTAFDAVDTGDDWVRIPKLEIALDKIEGENLIKQLPTLLAQAIRQQMLEGEIIHNVIDDGGLASTGRTAELSWLTQDESKEGVTQWVNEYELLLDYIQTGVLPWYIDDLSKMEERLANAVDNHFSQLNNWLCESANFYQYFRLFQLLDKTKLIELIQQHVVLQPMSSIKKLDLTKAIEQLLQQQNKTAIDYRQSAIVAALLTLTSGRSETRSIFITEDNKITLEEWRSWVKNFSLSKNDELALLDTALAFIVNQQVIASVDQSDSLSRRSDTQSVDSLLPKRTSHSLTGNDVADVISVDFVGLVLVAPYLDRFFQHCHLVIPSDSASSQNFSRAAALLCYLAIGHEEIQEYQLLFIKVLLGLSIDDPLLIAPGLLSRSDMDEADKLLTAFIEHWAALKTISLAGLRQAFLNRQGYLKKTEGAWSLTVERRGHDVLLDRFPFSYSMVKLSWMQQPIHVHW